MECILCSLQYLVGPRVYYVHKAEKALSETDNWSDHFFFKSSSFSSVSGSVMKCPKKSCVFHPVEVVSSVPSIFLCILTFAVWAFPILILLRDYATHLRSSIVEIPDVGRYSIGCCLNLHHVAPIILPYVLIIFIMSENLQNNNS